MNLRLKGHQTLHLRPGRSLLIHLQRAVVRAVAEGIEQGAHLYAFLGFLGKHRFQLLSPTPGQVTHALLTRSPLNQEKQAPLDSVRLACVRRAASVRPEPGSNSL